MKTNSYIYIGMEGGSPSIKQKKESAKSKHSTLVQ